MPLRTLFLVLLVCTAAHANSERRIFERAAADDDGTTTQLVFADWLDENGEPARAEFIRNQVAIMTMSTDDPNFATTRARGAELLAANRTAWFPPVEGVLDIELRAGLVDIVVAASADQVEAIRLAFPSVRHVRILGDLYRVARTPLLPNELVHLETLMVWLRRRAHRDLGAQALLRSLMAPRTCESILQLITQRP